MTMKCGTELVAMPKHPRRTASHRRREDALLAALAAGVPMSRRPNALNAAKPKPFRFEPDLTLVANRSSGASTLCGTACEQDRRWLASMRNHQIQPGRAQLLMDEAPLDAYRDVVQEMERPIKRPTRWLRDDGLTLPPLASRRDTHGGFGMPGTVLWDPALRAFRAWVDQERQRYYVGAEDGGPDEGVVVFRPAGNLTLRDPTRLLPTSRDYLLPSDRTRRRRYFIGPGETRLDERPRPLIRPTFTVSEDHAAPLAERYKAAMHCGAFGHAPEPDFWRFYAPNQPSPRVLPNASIFFEAPLFKGARLDIWESTCIGYSADGRDWRLYDTGHVEGRGPPALRDAADTANSVWSAINEQDGSSIHRVANRWSAAIPPGTLGTAPQNKNWWREPPLIYVATITVLYGGKLINVAEEPPFENGLLKTYLATSRDGVSFDTGWVYDSEQELIPQGKCQDVSTGCATVQQLEENVPGAMANAFGTSEFLCCEFDHGIVYPSSTITTRGTDDHLLFYEGRTGHHEIRYSRTATAVQVASARWRYHRISGMRRDPDAMHARCGMLLTKALPLPGDTTGEGGGKAWHVLVNVRVPHDEKATSSALVAELVRDGNSCCEGGTVLDGFAVADFQRLPPGNHTSAVLRWRGGLAAPPSSATTSARRVRLRFSLCGDAKLFSFTVVHGAAPPSEDVPAPTTSAAARTQEPAASSSSSPNLLEASMLRKARPGMCGCIRPDLRMRPMWLKDRAELPLSEDATQRLSLNTLKLLMTRPDDCFLQCALLHDGGSLIGVGSAASPQAGAAASRAGIPPGHPCRFVTVSLAARSWECSMYTSCNISYLYLPRVLEDTQPSMTEGHPLFTHNWDADKRFDFVSVEMTSSDAAAYLSRFSTTAAGRLLQKSSSGSCKKSARPRGRRGRVDASSTNVTAGAVVRPLLRFWPNYFAGIRDVADCLGACVGVPDCRYVTFSLVNSECTLFADCDMEYLARQPHAVSVELTPWSRSVMRSHRKAS